MNEITQKDWFILQNETQRLESVKLSELASHHCLIQFIQSFRLFGHIPKVFFCCFRPNNLGCRTFGASLYSYKTRI